MWEIYSYQFYSWNSYIFQALKVIRQAASFKHALSPQNILLETLPPVSLGLLQFRLEIVMDCYHVFCSKPPLS